MISGLRSCSVTTTLSLLLIAVTLQDCQSFSPSVGIAKTTSLKQQQLTVKSQLTRLSAADNNNDKGTTAAIEENKNIGSTFKQPINGDASDSIRQEADNALAAVGWSMPMEGDLTSDDPFVQAIDASIQKESGVPLDELLNPAKVVNLERDLYVSRLQLAQLTGRTVDTTGSDDTVKFITTQECDGGGGGDEATKLREKIAKKEADLIIERRAVFRGWLKNVFLGQAILSFVLSYVMATNPSSLFGGYDWYYSYNMDISISVLGYWWWWLFVIPSLRSRRPKGLEKKALDYAFIGTPLISLIAPIATKDTGLIWDANLLVVIASYAFAYTASNDESDNNNDDSNTPGWLKFIYKSLDFGSGRERGARQ